MELFIILMFLIVLVGVFNERVLKMQGDIALILFSVIICGGLYAVSRLSGMEGLRDTLLEISSFDFQNYLIDTVLCFMLFAGAGKVNMRKFGQNIKSIALLALLTTVVSSMLYGCLFYGIAYLLKLPLDLTTCILLGCIVSPTDPIAATGILNKLGLSKNVTVVIESESLFNDGTGVTLFIFFKSIVARSGNSNFGVLMAKEILGAVAVAFLVSFIMLCLFKLTREPVRQIIISLLAVSLTYVICEHFGFSGVIASVVCGMIFGTQREKIMPRLRVEDCHNVYGDFWEAFESILNAVLFAMIGITLFNLEISKYIWIILPLSILLNVLGRFIGVFVSSSIIGKKKMPGSYSLMEFTLLMTWSALKGGLSLALAMSTKEFLPPDVYLIILNVAYITIFFTVIVQGLTTKKVYLAIEKHKGKRFRASSQKAGE